MAKSSNAFTVVTQAPLVDSNGKATYTTVQLFKNWNDLLSTGLQMIKGVAQFIGNIGADAKIVGRSEGIGTTVSNILSDGRFNSLKNVALDRTLDNISDTASYQRTTPNQVVGATQAYSALVASAPVTGRTLLFNGTAWMPGQIAYSQVTGTPLLPADAPNSPSQWLKSYSSASATFTESQPGFSDIAGTLGLGQLPANVPQCSFGAGAPVGSSTEGYLYFDTSATPMHGYVYHAGAWKQFS
jgi:hypothetical protein